MPATPLLPRVPTGGAPGPPRAAHAPEPVALASIVALLVALLGNALAYHHAGYRPWAHAVGAACANVVHMAAVGAAAWWTARRTPAPLAAPAGDAGAAAGIAEAGARWRHVLVRHLGVAALAAGGAVALGAGARWLGHRGEAPPPLAPHPPIDVWASASWFVFWYGAVAAVAYVVAAQARLRAQERAAAQAQIAALRAQLNPHFLFNTLHSVAGLAREDPGAVEDVLERLGGLLRYVLRAASEGAAGSTAAAPTWPFAPPTTERSTAGDDVRRGDPGGPPRDAAPTAPVLVTVAEELAFVRDYLAIEQLRLGARLRVAEAVDDAVLGTRLPPLVLQPLVENAVRHAVAPRRVGATVTVRAWRERGRVVLEVADDGPGAATEVARRPRDVGRGVGLAAVRGQLAAHYGARASLTVHTAPGAGFRARVELPGGPDGAALDGVAAAEATPVGAWPGPARSAG